MVALKKYISKIQPLGFDIFTTRGLWALTVTTVAAWKQPFTRRCDRSRERPELGLTETADYLLRLSDGPRWRERWFGMLIVVARIAGHMVKPSGTREIVRRQFQARGRMGEQPALGNRADAAVAVPEDLQDPDVTGPGFEPEIRFQCCDRDHAFDGAIRANETKRHATVVRQHLRFKFEGFHKRDRE